MEFDKKILKEIYGFLDVRREFVDKKKVPVIFDGSQYTIKIPKKLAEKASIERAFFEFEAITRLVDGKRKTVLKGEIVNAQE